jgi:hypothetical protein
MRAIVRPLCLLALLLAGLCPARADEALLRAAIGKSLGYLAKEGEHWMEVKDCNGCHHLSGLLWSHREAARRGFPVDQKKFDAWLAWADERDADKQPKVEEAAFMILAMPDRPSANLTRAILDQQRPDGGWAPAGQLVDMQIRGAPEARGYSARLVLLALATPPGAGEVAETARAKAKDFLAKEVPPKAMDTLMYRLLYAKKFGSPEEVAKLRQEILKRQRRDGGWSYILDENQSDALGTGEALYALATAPDAANEKAVAHAQEWLLSTQREDGGWAIDYTHLSKVDRSSADRASSRKDIAQIYGYWGTSWATIGLLQAIPPGPAPN